MALITKTTLDALGGKRGQSSGGGIYWDFAIETKFSKGDTFLRVHEGSEDGYPCDLCSAVSGHKVGIVNWPTTIDELLLLFRVLGVKQ